jgi:hypothetical protein
MRKLIPLIAAAAVGSCTAVPPPAPIAPSPQAQMRLNELLAGKTPGAPQSCLPNWRTHNMVVVDDSTIVFRESSNRVWVQRPHGACDRLSNPSYALSTRSVTNRLCQGDVAQVVDPQANIGVGSCVLGDFVPYTR